MDGQRERNLRIRAKVKVFRNTVLIDEIKYNIRAEPEATTWSLIWLQYWIMSSPNGHLNTQIRTKLCRKEPYHAYSKNSQRQRHFIKEDDDLTGSKAILVIFTKDEEFFEKFSLSHRQQTSKHQEQ